MRSRLFIVLGWALLLAAMGGANALAQWLAPTQEDLIDALGQLFTAPSQGQLGATAALGFLLLGAWLTGRLFDAMHLPKVSGYLLFGVLVGPHLVPALAPEGSLQPLVTQDQLDNLNLINALAISLIALTAGGEIKVDFLRKGLKRISIITGIEMSMVLIGVSTLMFLAAPIVRFMPDEETKTTLIVCALIATVAIANSPAIVIALLSETNAKGPMAQSALTITILKDLALIILFTVVVTVATTLLADAGLAEQATPVEGGGLAAHLAWHLLGSIVVGFLAGRVLSLLVQRMLAFLPLFVIGTALGIALFSQTFGFEALLVALTAGFTMANLKPERSESFFHAMEQLALPVYCVFFAAAGAKVDIEAVRVFWPVALAIVGVRVTMIYSGTWLGAKLGGLESPARNWLWTALIPQAGVTVALITSLERAFGEYRWSVALVSLLLAVVAIHELIGPLLMRVGLSRCGEIDGEDRSKPETESTSEET